MPGAGLGEGWGVLSGFLGGVCRWDSETLTLYQTTPGHTLTPYSRLDTKNPYTFLDFTLTFNPGDLFLTIFLSILL